MRCPKCSYISYDLIETCVKCGKNISSVATDLMGSVASVVSPAFLRLSAEEAPETVEESADFEAEEALDLGAEGDEVEMDFSLDEEPSIEAAEEELDLGEEAAAEETADFDMGFEEEAVEEERAEEEIGISDLGPAEEAEEAVAAVAEEAAAATGGQGLEDLKVEGIDLESTPGADSEKIMPSVKTGTALDDFDIDLGDLLTGKKD